MSIYDIFAAIFMGCLLAVIIGSELADEFNMPHYISFIVSLPLGVITFLAFSFYFSPKKTNTQTTKGNDRNE